MAVFCNNSTMMTKIISVVDEVLLREVNAEFRLTYDGHLSRVVLEKQSSWSEISKEFKRNLSTLQKLERLLDFKSVELDIPSYNARTYKEISRRIKLLERKERVQFAPYWWALHCLQPHLSQLQGL